MSAQPVVQVEDLDVYYGTSQILFGVGLSVRQGETMALLGRNGAGKSTTMKAIMGLAPARRGRVTLKGRVVSGLKPHHIARAHILLVRHLQILIGDRNRLLKRVQLRVSINLPPLALR